MVVGGAVHFTAPIPAGLKPYTDLSWSRLGELVVMTTYISPFGKIGDADHNGPDALCLSRTHCTDAVEDTLREFYEATTAVIASRAPQPAFFLARQLAELACKALLGPKAWRTHNLVELLNALEGLDDDLLSGGVDQELVVEFIKDLAECDEGGDEGRYPTTTSGSPALAEICCADPTLLGEHVDRLHSYVQGRLRTRSAASAITG
jgi:HEPN domain-containing protein